MTKTMKTLLLASALAIGATAAFAQNHSRSPYAVSNDGPNGEGRNTGYGQGGSAGTHPTGANVGPGRAAMDHATGY
jgi:Spy/CpxP family protein refolding chaperone